MAQNKQGGAVGPAPSFPKVPLKVEVATHPSTQSLVYLSFAQKHHLGTPASSPVQDPQPQGRCCNFVFIALAPV